MDTVLKAASAEATLDAAPADLQPNTQAVVRPVHTLVECDHSTTSSSQAAAFIALAACSTFRISTDTIRASDAISDRIGITIRRRPPVRSRAPARAVNP